MGDDGARFALPPRPRLRGPLTLPLVRCPARRHRPQRGRFPRSDASPALAPLRRVVGEEGKGPRLAGRVRVHRSARTRHAAVSEARSWLAERAADRTRAKGDDERRVERGAVLGDSQQMGRCVGHVVDMCDVSRGASSLETRRVGDVPDVAPVMGHTPRRASMCAGWGLSLPLFLLPGQTPPPLCAHQRAHVPVDSAVPCAVLRIRDKREARACTKV